MTRSLHVERHGAGFIARVPLGLISLIAGILWLAAAVIAATLTFRRSGEADVALAYMLQLGSGLGTVAWVFAIATCVFGEVAGRRWALWGLLLWALGTIISALVDAYNATNAGGGLIG